MAGERETTYGLNARMGRAAMQSRPVSHRVTLRSVGPVGLALAVRLLDAGYIVGATGVLEECVRQFQAAGGLVLVASDGSDSVSWEIECHEQPGVRPETLARMTEHFRGYGRPRLEFRGAGNAFESGRDATIGALVVRPGQQRPGSDRLQVSLDVNPRGLQLVIRGERTLFESALPLLTVLADRVLYAGTAALEIEDSDRLACELPPKDHA